MTDRDTPVDITPIRRVRAEVEDMRETQRFLIAAAIVLAVIQAGTVGVIVWLYFNAYVITGK